VTSRRTGMPTCRPDQDVCHLGGDVPSRDNMTVRPLVTLILAGNRRLPSHPVPDGPIVAGSSRRR